LVLVFVIKLLLTLSAKYTPHDGDVICSGCSASYRQKWHQCFWERKL